MNRPNARRGVPDLKLERFLLGELPPEDMERLRSALRDDPALCERLEALRQSDQEIHSHYPPAWMSRQILRKRDRLAGAPPARLRSLSGFWPLSTLAVAAVLLIVVVLPRMLSHDNGAPADRGAYSGMRVKGLRPYLAFYRKTEGGVERLREGDLVREGDLLQVVYHAAGRRYGVILSSDGRGAVTRHLPDVGGHAAALKAGQPDSLKFAYQLDDAPLQERFYFVTAAAPFEVETVLKAIHQIGTSNQRAGEDSLDLPGTFDQFIFTLKKGARR